MEIVTKAVYRITDSGIELESKDSVEYKGEVVECKSAPSPPPPPDPSIAIAANAKANRINTVTPFGTTKFTSPAGAVSDVTRTDTLSPSQQRQLDQRNSLGEALLGIGQQQIGQFDTSPLRFKTADSGQNQAFNRQLGLLQPDFTRQEDALRQRLSNQGIPEGSVLFDNELRKLRETQGRVKAGLANQADVTGQNQAISQRTQNFNELAALLGGQQLNTNQVATPQIDTQAAFNAQQAQQQSNFQAKNASANNFNQGLFSLGGAAITGGLDFAGTKAGQSFFSDRRLKKNIKRIGTHILGIGIYVFDYIWDEHSIGVMADEVKEVMPDAVIRHGSGFDMVNYAMIGGVRYA